MEGFHLKSGLKAVQKNPTLIMIDYTAGHGLATGGTRISYVTVNNNEDPLKITLVWTDYPSTPSSSVNIVNVLHFSLTTVDNNIRLLSTLTQQPYLYYSKSLSF